MLLNSKIKAFRSLCSGFLNDVTSCFFVEHHSRRDKYFYIQAKGNENFVSVRITLYFKVN